MAYKYGKPPIGMAFGAQRLFSGEDVVWETRWEPSEPNATATLWRYMSFAKFCSLLERRELFFSLVSAMEDTYEGFICRPPRDPGDRLYQAESIGRNVLYKIARTALISCWTESDSESALMWKTYVGAEGVAVRTTFQDLKESIRSAAEHPVIFGQVKYVDYPQQSGRAGKNPPARPEVPRFEWSPLFHKRIVYREEKEVRAVLPGPPWDDLLDPEVLAIRLDADVAEQRGRYVPVDLEILVKQVVVSSDAAPWFAEVVKSVMQRAEVGACVIPSAI